MRIFAIAGWFDPKHGKHALVVRCEIDGEQFESAHHVTDTGQLASIGKAIHAAFIRAAREKRKASPA
jgi:hypothetical protein